MGKVASPRGTFGVNIVAKALADSHYSAFSLAIGLMMVSSSHVEINLDLAINCCQKREVNLGSLSETIEVGKPWTEKIPSMRILEVSAAVMFCETGIW